MRKFVAVGLAGVAKHGPRQASIIAAKRLVSWGRRRWRRRAERRFDRERGIDTTGVGATPTDADSVRYQATMPERFRQLMKAIDVEPSRFTFIDLGCGKGRTLILASELGFRRVVGVENDSELVQAARRNANVAAPDVEIEHLNASLYAFPPEPTIVYLYNPFLDRAMPAMLANLQRSLRDSPRPVYVVYLNPVLGKLLDRQPFLERVRTQPDAAIYRVAAAAA